MSDKPVVYASKVKPPLVPRVLNRVMTLVKPKKPYHAENLISQARQTAGLDDLGAEDGWREAEALFSTLTDEELTDPALPATDLVYRLFHEGGVAMDSDAQELDDVCTCNRERLVGTLQGMADESLRDMVEPDGTLKVDCQFCSRQYVIQIDEVTRAAN